MSEIALSRLTTTLIHEMTHMWFGNLVTPVWWDDLWLNESFATFISYLVSNRVSPYNTMHDLADRKN